MKTNISILFIMLCGFLTACGDSEKKQEKDDAEETVAQGYSQLPEITSINKDKLAEINKWKKFNELSVLMERFQEQESGDLTYFAEEFKRLQGEIEKDSLFPPKFNIPAVKSRLVVFETFTNQLQTRLEESAPLDSVNISRKKVLEAYNAMRQQLAETLKSKIYEDFINKKDSNKTSKMLQKS
ncbi:hypothetical protein [Galbibacter mesophilus]|uniref:hypothetical protein n=1 Tax=Galbibacter mesophilus TaxID=379069 RepID=UPI001F5CA796|nr:hypothetical protein [Galbibacter mesophilus]MCM5661993.1 hypothetical protein [Galbibacter mesophilus]